MTGSLICLMIWITRGLINIFWNQIIPATFHDQTRHNQTADQTRTDQIRQEILSQDYRRRLITCLKAYHTVHLIRGPIQAHLDLFWILLCAIICEHCGKALITEVDTSLSLTTPVFSNLNVFCVICQKMALVTFSPQHVAFESKLVTPRGQHWGQPGTSSPHHHLKIIIIITSSCQNYHHHYDYHHVVTPKGQQGQASREHQF